MQIKKAVLLAARDGSPSGDNIHLVCPACSQKTMYYNPTNGGYYCFRNKCGVKGYTKRGVTVPTQPKDPLYDRISTLPMRTARPTDASSDYLDFISYPVKYSEDYQRVVYEVRDFSGQCTGYVLRAYNGQLPKALTACNGVPVHVPAKALGATSVCIVEDIVSAEKLSHVYPAVAILGTHITPEVRSYLYDAGVRDIIIALDEDAGGKAVAMSRRFISFTTSVKLLTKDPKDSTIEELQEIFLCKT